MSEWFSRIMPGYAPSGQPILSVLGKRTYRFENGKAAVEDAEEQIPFTEADEFWGQGNPQSDAVKLESDLIAFKPMTDVVLIGKAHVPSGGKARQLDVGIQIGNARKLARVIGNRKVFITGTGMGFTDPEPFSEMALDYSLAYGGKDEVSEPGALYVNPKNPVGKGFAVKHNVALQGLELPNLEDPAKLLTPQNLVLGRFERWKEYPDPVAFGYANKNSYPRYTLAGLPPEEWSNAEVERQRALQKTPEVGSSPSDQPPARMPMINLEFYNGAAAGMKFPHLAGNEPVRLANMDAKIPHFSFSLPGAKPQAWLDVGKGRVTMPMVLHTAVIYKPTNQLTMVWRGCSGYGGIPAMEKFKKLAFGVEG